MYQVSKNTDIQGLLILENAGLNWTATKETLQTASGIITDSVAIVRDDTQKILGVHKASYEIFQNQQMIDTIMQLSETANLPIHKAGLLNGGTKVFIQLKTDDLNFNYGFGKGDSVKGYLTAINSFDGSTSLAFGHSTTTISCQNTFFGAYRGLASKIKHTKSMSIKVDDLLRMAEQVKAEEKINFETIKKLSEVPMTDNFVDDVLKGLFAVSLADVKADADTISTRNKNNISRFRDALQQETDYKGKTLWGLFSGVTKYTTHMLGADKEDTKMFGSVAQKERRLFEQFAEVVR
jgi:phage/plasmid-like protein (TIGR03299 family)